MATLQARVLKMSAEVDRCVANERDRKSADASKLKVDMDGWAEWQPKENVEFVRKRPASVPRLRSG